MSTAKNVALTLGAATAGYWLFRKLTAGNYDFRNKVVIVTGGSRGLGLVLARRLAAAGARVAICARDQDELDRARDDVARHGPAPLAVRCDVAQPDDAARLIAEVERERGPVDVLINNAGTISVGPEETMTLEDFHQAMNINFYGAVHTVLAVLPSMRRRKAGRIVNITSIGGKIAVPHLLPYTASKFALVGFSEGLRAELAPDGIVVTTICPGLMRTGSPRNALFKGQNEAEYAWFSVGDSLPGLTISAESAADRILEACRRGESEVVLGLPSKAAAVFHGIFPGLSSDLAALVSKLLPAPGGIGTAAKPGSQSESSVSQSVLTTLSQRAAERNNEIRPSER